ncbi:MAG: flagellar M-ring protein FliF [Proteobacteria bacterium]|nr:flagellar M-ring protein FliF [Pseudomonadota bacterium]
MANTGLGSIKSLLLLGILSVFVSGLVVFLMWGYGPAYQVLYSGLSGNDSGAVIDRLRELGVPYKVEGNSISVPSENVYETRMELAGQGLPQGNGVGYEIFDTSSFGVTQFVQKINYKRALQGELSRTISQINEVDTARVHMSIPDSGSFFGEDRRSKASVIIKLRAGKSLSQGQVASIVHLISNSTENLNTTDVTVVDTEGRMWTRSSKDGDAYGMGATQAEYRGGMEKNLERRVESMLEKTVGMDRVVARVSVDVETRHVEKTEEVFDPEGVVPRSEQSSKESTTGGMSGGGVPGVLSNLPGGTQGGAGQGGSAPQSKTDTETINYEISKTVSHTIEPITNIKRMTVAVLVDGSYDVTTDADGNEVRTYVARTDEEIASYVSMVEGAVGFSEERGDEITVVSTPFSSELFAGATIEEEASAPLIPMTLVPSLIKYASVFLIALISILFILRPLVKRLLGEVSGVVGGGGGVALTAGGMPVQAMEAGAEEAVEVVQSEESKTLNVLKDSVKSNPEQAAMVIKGMVKER